MENVNEKFKVEDFYNGDVKIQFLNTYDEKTQTPYARIFLHSKPLEEKLNKDLYNFNVSEIKEFLGELNPLTAAASRTNGRIASAYMYWAVDNGLSKNKINPLNDVDPAWFEQFVTDPYKIYLTKRELTFEIEDQCNNAQDSVILQLIFEGVQGSKDCAELCNLRKQDIDFDNRTLTLTDYDGSKRSLQVSHRCIKEIEDAIKQKEYHKKNGEMQTDSHLVKRIVDLVQNDYVIRNTISRTDRYESVDKHTIYRRINMVRDVTGFENLTVKSISRSGMMAEAKRLMEENNGELTKDHLEQIAHRFGVKNIYNMMDFLKPEVIKAVYSRE